MIAVVHQQFPNGGAWSKFVCRCGRRCQKLRLFEGRPACRRCLIAAGMQYRSDMCSHFSKRTALTAPKRVERLYGGKPARLHPRPGRMLDRRVNLEAKLRRSLIVARQFALDEHDKMLAKLLEDK